MNNKKNNQNSTSYPPKFYRNFYCWARMLAELSRAEAAGQSMYGKELGQKLGVSQAATVHQWQQARQFFGFELRDTDSRNAANLSREGQEMVPVFQEFIEAVEKIEQAVAAIRQTHSSQ